jgi:glycine/D-amino acid oxidase-like deaminating enzyme/nitrite reductase/ring-hydroxylating ferredoxin subunit
MGPAGQLCIDSSCLQLFQKQAMSSSAWQSVSIPHFDQLKRSARFDVVVVGGGITGLSAAWFLKQAGKSVAVIERNRIGSGDTGCTSGHLTMVTDIRLTELVKLFGENQARLVWDAGAAAINSIEAIVDEHKLDCQFRRVPGFLHAAIGSSKNQSRTLREEAELAQHLGLDVDFVESVPLVGKPGYRVADQAKFHPLAYLAGLARLIPGRGSAIFTSTEATEVEDEPLVVKCGKARIECDYLVIATHVPLIGKARLIDASMLQMKLASYSSYIVGAKVPRNALPEVCLWDTSDPYYYLRVDRGARDDYVIFGGEDHKTGQQCDTNENFSRLFGVLKQLVPKAVVDRRWSGQVIQTTDGLPFIGEIAERQFIATGFAGNGLTFGTLAGLMARDAMLKQENPWRELFAVGRKKIRGGTWDFVKENIDYPYYYVKDRLALAQGKSTREVKRGQGKILKLQGQQVACSRDDHGTLQRISAVCTHLGCLVRWNPAERTWDCPCHGSRFKPDGEVLAGPAETPLEKVKGTSRSSGQIQKPRRRRSLSPNKDQ